MAIYSIRDLEKLTGIKAHTIRIWEQRYGLVVPARTETNIRYYTDENLRLLFNIALLNRNGYKISKLAQMSDNEIAERVADIAENNGSQNAQIDALTLAMIDLDEATFDRIFSTYTWENGFERTMVELVYPFLDKLNVLWLTNSVSPAHEKFIGHLIRRKLMAAIDKESAEVPRDAATFVLYLPDDESQELTLLFMYYLLRSRHKRVIYLGHRVSLSDLEDACQPLRPDYVFTIIQEPIPRHPIQTYVEAACEAAKPAEVLLTGAQLFVNQVTLPSNAHILNGLQETIDFLDSLELKLINARTSSVGDTRESAAGSAK
ncbi:MAG: MerR family transcriptional regulator [Saprospiraceae bacterium]|nr:MerR family transcriptional regulator [Saprospiraceae bacterium]